MFAPRLRKIALIAVGVGIVVGVVAAIFLPWPIALAIGLVVGAPTAMSAVFGMRGRIWLAGNTVHVRRVLGERQVDVSRTVSAELLVHVARVSQVGVRIGDGNKTVTVPLALYAHGGGRELDLVALRKLADALAAGELVAAAAVASVLVQQLRAEALDAGLEQRPLYRAVKIATDAGRTPRTTLTDSEVASLL
ncbi:hypothetical protein FOY51_08755 [Antrihabitans cavernicola]|uniref:Uncharacterized protein n=1 Tax=Antrihabitans cavernicola TaxID=2495913 RepID=A0A5A7SDS8_9NOCA|nr:hypothetical protein [Spelaeibacter cavernicola]KAA0023694.1 hypothetical protein FOY51_08755 [Spelaeibacter cavernicola]